MYKIFEAIRIAEQSLKEAKIDSCRLDSRILLQHVLSISKEELVLNCYKSISNSEYNDFVDLVNRRKSREPVSKILGKKEFWSMEFKVNEHILDPRPDTETLIEYVIESYKEKVIPENILDLGTGSGCILLSILSEFKKTKGVGIDKNYQTIKVAKYNSEQLHLNDRSSFINANWNDSILSKFDLITSNPPYIRSDDINKLEPEVYKYDPMKALDGGSDGLDCYKYLAKNTEKSLSKNGVIFLEIGESQESDIVKIFEQNNFKLINFKKDLSNIIRCLSFRMA